MNQESRKIGKRTLSCRAVIFAAALIPIFALAANPAPLYAAKPRGNPATAGPSRAALLQTIAHIQALAVNAVTQLNAEKAAHKITDEHLADATTKNVDLQKQIQAQTDKLNATQDKLDKAAKALWWYRLHWWLGWIIFGIGVAVCILFAVLKVTGKLGL